jgi:hypothetical protein
MSGWVAALTASGVAPSTQAASPLSLAVSASCNRERTSDDVSSWSLSRWQVGQAQG